jgi:transcriptional regulator with XRE-family HTH domain
MNSNNLINSFGEQIRSLRETRKLSLKEVANSIGIDTSLLGKIERDERQPTKDQIKSIAVYYNINEHLLKNENLSDQLAYKIIDADADIEIFKVAEQKIEYFKLKKENK